MHIVIKPVDVRSIQAVIVVAADEYLVTIWLLEKTVQEINRFPFSTDQSGLSRDEL